MKLERAIERFCYKHPRFGIRNLMMILVIGNIAVYLLGNMDTTGTLGWYLCFSPEMILRGQVWRLITFVFIPPTYGSIFSVAISLYFYYFIGSTLERQWGTCKFTLYYLCGMLLSIIYGFVSEALGFPAEYVVDAYYINMSMFFAFATTWPDATVFLFFIIPIKMKWLALINVALFVFGIIGGGSLMPVVAILNYLIFCGGTLASRVFKAKSYHSRRADFRAKVQQADRAKAQAPYRHKCSVCGRTDVTNPELEFRYCSRCAGYHCFCEEHINNHVHFTE